MNSENTSRLLGIMYCGAYAHRADGSEDASIYVAYNFHWEDRIFALPNLAGYRKWKKVIDTSAVKRMVSWSRNRKLIVKAEGHTAYDRGADGCRGGEERCIRGCTLKQ